MGGAKRYPSHRDTLRGADIARKIRIPSGPIHNRTRSETPPHRDGHLAECASTRLPLQLNLICHSWDRLLAIFLKRFVKSLSPPGAPSPSTKATASVRVASEAVKPPDGHWGKMSTGQWAWLSEIRSPIAQDQELARSIVPPNLKIFSILSRKGPNTRKAQGRLPRPPDFMK